MDRLHGWDHPERGEARDVVTVQRLRVLDAEAVISHRMRGERGLVRVEHHAVAAIADGMRRHLEARRERTLGDVLDVPRGAEQQPAVGRIVAVRLEQRGAAGSHGTISVELDAADPQAIVIEADLWAAREIVQQRERVVADHHVQAERQLAVARERLGDVDRGA